MLLWSTNCKACDWGTTRCSEAFAWWIKAAQIGWAPKRVTPCSPRRGSNKAARYKGWKASWSSFFRRDTSKAVVQNSCNKVLVSTLCWSIWCKTPTNKAMAWCFRDNFDRSNGWMKGSSFKSRMSDVNESQSWSKMLRFLNETARAYIIINMWSWSFAGYLGRAFLLEVLRANSAVWLRYTWS